MQNNIQEVFAGVAFCQQLIQSEKKKAILAIITLDNLFFNHKDNCGRNQSKHYNPHT